MKYKKTTFQDDWLLVNKYKMWLEKVRENPYSAYCKLCKRKFSLSNMGVCALASHMVSAKHKAREADDARTPKLGNILQVVDHNANKTTTSISPGARGNVIKLLLVSIF